MLTLFTKIAFIVSQITIFCFTRLRQHFLTNTRENLFLCIAIFITRLHSDNILHDRLIKLI